jgi:hypothetical protein
MAFVNLPPNLQDIFNNLSDRIAKLESGPNSAAYTADDASTQATIASAQAANALAQSTIAQSQATIASSQATQAQTSADGKNKVYYSTSTPGSTANQVGDIWYQYGTSSPYTNKVIAQWSGAGGTSWTSVTVSGLVIANIDAGSITAGTLSAIEISAGTGGTAFHVSPSGFMSAQGVYVKGNIVCDTINANGASIGGFTIGSSFIGNPSTTYGMDSSNGYATFSILGTSGIINSGITTSSGNVNANAYLYNSGHATTTSGANVFINSTAGANFGLIARVTSSERYKVAIEQQSIPMDSILALQPKSYVDKAEAEEKGTTDGLPRLLGLIAEDLAQIPVLKDLLVVYNDQGQPDAVNYDRIAIALIPIIQDMAKEIAELKAQLNP